MSNVEPVADGAAIPGWAPIIEDPALAALLRPGAVLHRLATGATWAEGPVWLPHDGSVVWSDVVGNRVLRWDPDGRVVGAPGGRRVRERPHARSRRVDRGLLARPSAHRTTGPRRDAHADRRSLPGSAVQLAQRRRRQVRRHDLVHGPALRHHEQPRGSPGRLRDRRLPRVPVRPAHGRARRRHRLGRRAERPRVLARRDGALRLGYVPRVPRRRRRQPPHRGVRRGRRADASRTRASSTPSTNGCPTASAWTSRATSGRRPTTGSTSSRRTGGASAGCRSRSGRRTASSAAPTSIACSSRRPRPST